MVMSGKIFYLAFILAFSLKFYVFDNPKCYSKDNIITATVKDSIFYRQYLYNGRVWRDLYSHKVNGDEYLYTKNFLPGAVTFNSRSFKNLNLRYDIYNDEILILTNQGNVLVLNKEMVDSFNLEYEDIIHNFENLGVDSMDMLKGYVEVLYKGNTSLYIKHIKVISRLAQGKPYDSFEETHRAYLLKDGKTYRVNTKNEFISLLDDKQDEIRTFIRSHKLKVKKKNPESFVPVLRFYDSISQ
jgi:hypothetical protein